MKQKEGAKKPFSVLCAVALVASLCLPTAALADVGASDQAQGANSAASAGQVADAQAAAGDAANANAADAADAAEPAKQAADEEALAAEPAVQSDNEGAAVQAEGVAAIGNTQYATLQAAIDAAKDGDTIKLLSDVVETVTNKNWTITLDLNGKTITNDPAKASSGYGQASTIINFGELVIEGEGTVDNVSNAAAALYNGVSSKVTINGGTFTRSKEAGTSAGSNGNSWYVICNHGGMFINNAIVKSNSGLSSLIENGYQNSSVKKQCEDLVMIPGKNLPLLTINGGTFDGSLNTVKNDDYATVVVNGGTFLNNTQATFQNHNDATINGGTFSPTDNAWAVLNCGVCGSVADGDSHSLAIHGGVFNGPVSVTVGEVSVDKGVFNGDLAVGSNGKLSISGGNFSSCPDPAYIADGYVATAAYDVLKASASAGEGSAAGSAAVAPSEVKPELSDDSAKALASTAGKTAESLLKSKQLPDNVKVDNADLDTIKGIAESIKPEDKVSVTFVVDAQPVEKSDDAIAKAKKSNENQYDIDVSVRMLIAVNGTDASASVIAKVTELPEGMQITVTVDPSFIKDKSVRIARNHDGKVDFITPTKVDYATGEITFTTNLFSSYAVLASDKPAPTPVVTHAVSFVDKFNNVTNVADVEDGQAVAQPKDPSFDGYEFVGWFTDEAAQNKYDFSTPVKGDLTLYAGYKKVEQPANNNGSDKGDNGSTAEAPAATALAQTGDNVVPIALGAVALGALLIAAGALVLRRRSQR